MDEIRKEIIEMYEQLSEEDKVRVSWLIGNIDKAERFSGGKSIPVEEIDTLMKEAYEKEDRSLFMFLAYKKQFDENRKKKNNRKRKSNLDSSSFGSRE